MERISRERDPMIRSGGGMEMDDTRRTRYPDNQQLFVGNLPHNIQEKDLKTFFESMQYHHIFCTSLSIAKKVPIVLSILFINYWYTFS